MKLLNYVLVSFLNNFILYTVLYYSTRGENKIAFLLVFALITGKDEDLYTILFSKLNKINRENGICFKINEDLEIITNFEQAASN